MDLTRVTSDNVLAQADLLISHVVPSNESQRAYRRAIRELMDWWARRQETNLDKALVYRYRSYLVSRNLAPASINQKLSAIRKLAVELGDNGTLSPTVAAAITRISSVRMQGVRTGRWLTPDEANRLLAAPDRSTLKGKRDRAVLAVAIDCGLRRYEIATLMVQTIQQRAGRWVLVDIRGKNGRIRSVPMAFWAKDIVDEWRSAAGITCGCVFRAVNKAGRVHREGISAQAIYEIIKGYGIDIGVTIAPHDLRRSFARMAHSGQSPLEQIQFSLGHASVATTERYIGARQNLIDAPCDRLGIMLPSDPSPSFEDEWTVTELDPNDMEMWNVPPGIGTFRASGLANACADYTDLFRSLCGEDFVQGSAVEA